MAAIWDRLMAAYSAFRNAGVEPVIDPEGRYSTLWALYSGSMFDAAWRARPTKYRDPRLYLNTRLLWKHVESTVDFYAATVYQGSLSTDGQPLPGGQPEAIPIDPQTGQEGTDDQLRLGIAELWNASNWRSQMMLRPMYGACLGDCLTELVDDVPGRKVLPLTIWPGYVCDLELDSVGNVKYVAIEYPVHVTPRRKDDGTKEEKYVFRKELSGEDFRYYKNDKPFDYSGAGSVVLNPYRVAGEARGFVPVIWDRHKQVWQDRGHCAFEGTIQALLEVNSFLSHGFDYQRKAFAAPIVIQGNIARPSTGVLRLSRPTVTDDPDVANAAAQTIAESQDVLTATGDKVGIFQISADIGQALAVVKEIQDGILDENPEARFWNELRGMSQVSRPGALIALGDAISRCKLAQAGYDAQSVKLFQMWLAISGMRVNAGDWGPVDQLSKRQRAWMPFDMESYGRGDLDFGIKDRDPIPVSQEEIINLVILKESVSTAWGMREVGIEEEAIEETLGERERQREAQLAAFSVAGAGQDEGATGPSGPSGPTGVTGNSGSVA